MSLITNNSITDNYYPTYDGNGNVSEYLAADGSTAAHFEYDPFGNTIVNTDTNNQFAYRFSTKPLDPTTGFYYYGYRYYDPVTGRWPSRDPIGERGGKNLNGFLGNDGVQGIDLFGLMGPFSPFTVHNHPGIPRNVEEVHNSLDIIGTADPTPICDTLNALIYVCEGDPKNVAISACGLLPYLGDAAKACRLAKKTKKGLDVVDPPPVKPSPDPSKSKIPDGWCNCQLHHIATNKNDIDETQGGPWTPKFRTEFAKAGLDPDTEPANRCLVCDVGDGRVHKGPHPKEYHVAIYGIVSGTVNVPNTSPADHAENLRTVLLATCATLNVPGNPLRLLITK
jgi:RHS repeat-associated protein